MCFFRIYEESAKFSSTVDIDGKYAPQEEKCSLATLRVVILMNANPSDPVHRITLFVPFLEESDPISETFLMSLINTVRFLLMLVW